MPEINKLAKESTTFTNCYTQASHSNYANLGPLSGQYPLRSHGTHVYPHNPPYPRTPIYDILKPLGWSTGIVSSSNDHWGKVINYLDTGTLDIYLNPENMGTKSSVAETDLGFAKWVTNTKHAGSVDDKFTVNKAIEWISSLDKNKPFFCTSTCKPHISHTDFLKMQKLFLHQKKWTFAWNLTSTQKIKLI